MRVSAVSVNCCPKPPKRLIVEQPKVKIDTEGDKVSFKGKYDKAAVVATGTIGAIAGGVVGFCLGGPLGALAGAALVGGAGASAQQDEIDFKKENPGESYYDDYTRDRMSKYD